MVVQTSSHCDPCQKIRTKKENTSSDSVKRHLSRRYLSVLNLLLFLMMGAPAKTKCALAKAASIPACRQSESAGPSLFGFIFRRCPPSWIWNFGGHLKPVTLKPVSRIFRIFRVLVSAFSAFSAFSLCGTSSDPCFSGVRGTVRIFRIFPVSGLNRWFRKSDRPALLWPALGDWEISHAQH